MNVYAGLPIMTGDQITGHFSVLPAIFLFYSHLEIAGKYILHCLNQLCLK